MRRQFPRKPNWTVDSQLRAARILLEEPAKADHSPLLLSWARLYVERYGQAHTAGVKMEQLDLFREGA